MEPQCFTRKSALFSDLTLQAEGYILEKEHVDGNINDRSFSRSDLPKRRTRARNNGEWVYNTYPVYLPFYYILLVLSVVSRPFIRPSTWLSVPKNLLTVAGKSGL